MLPHPISIFFQLVIILVLAFLRRRVYKWPQCCDGRPGIVMYVKFSSILIFIYVKFK